LGASAKWYERVARERGRIIFGNAEIDAENGGGISAKFRGQKPAHLPRGIDVVEHAGVACARLARFAGHEPLGESRNGSGIVVVEERALSAAMRVRLGSCADVIMLPVRLGATLGDKTDAGDNACPHRRALEERAASFVMLAHDSIALPHQFVRPGLRSGGRACAGSLALATYGPAKLTY
jgi:hypothetical protein